MITEGGILLQCIGDQQAALVGQMCLSAGQLTCNLLFNTAQKITDSDIRLQAGSGCGNILRFGRCHSPRGKFARLDARKFATERSEPEWVVDAKFPR